MQSAMWLASIFGPFLVILGLWMLFYQEHMSKVMTSMKNSPMACSMGCFYNILIGLVIINQYNVWMWGISLLVTLLGWVMLIRGLIGLFFPQILQQLCTPAWNKVRGIVPLVWGFALCWYAFWM